MAQGAVTYKCWLDWFVSTNDIDELWQAQPTYMISQAVFLLAGFVTLLHAIVQRGRWKYFWLGTVLHGIIVENFWHFILPQFDNIWHSQTPLMFLGHRQPLHILFLYPAFMYNAAYSVSKIGLPKYVEPFAVGLLVVLIDMPYDIVSVKFVHWTWHDTDPNIFDRNYYVPWNSYYFHATFAASFYYFFILTRIFYDAKTPEWQSSKMKVECMSLLIATILAMPGGVLLFAPIYQPVHDDLLVHSQVKFFVLFSVYSGIIVNGFLKRVNKTKAKATFIDYVLLLQLALHYIIYWVFVVNFNPEEVISTGFHEPVGPCNETIKVTTRSGETWTRRIYLCVNDYDEDYFDFECVGGKTPPNGTKWYTICGTPFANRSEYINIITIILISAAGIFHAIYFKGNFGDTNIVSPHKIGNQKKKLIKINEEKNWVQKLL